SKSSLLMPTKSGQEVCPFISSSRHGRKKRNFVAVIDQFAVFGMLLIDRSANDMLMLEGCFIFISKRLQVADQITHACFRRGQFDDLLTLADFLAHPCEIDEFYRHWINPSRV